MYVFAFRFMHVICVCVLLDLCTSYVCSLLNLYTHVCVFAFRFMHVMCVFTIRFIHMCVCLLLNVYISCVLAFN